MKKMILGIILGLLLSHGFSQEIKELKRFKAPNATQAIAVDKDHFYTISNYRIIKRAKESGAEVGRWEGVKDGPIAHLNSGIILEGKLYCANSNYPKLPMWSSLEIFDPETMKHIGSHSFGIYIGSLTWVDRYDGAWWAMFVHYDPEKGYPDKSVAWTQLVRFNDQWQRTAAYVLSDSMVEHLRPMSISGGYFNKEGKIICSPHHFEEIYVMSLPKQGSELRWEKTIKVPFQGQGICADPEDQTIWGIHRKNREVMQIRMD